jgi:hypothetical protein
MFLAVHQSQVWPFIGEVFPHYFNDILMAIFFRSLQGCPAFTVLDIKPCTVFEQKRYEGRVAFSRGQMQGNVTMECPCIKVCSMPDEQLTDSNMPLPCRVV